jgi:hypothetical protein
MMLLSRASFCLLVASSAVLLSSSLAGNGQAKSESGLAKPSASNREVIQAAYGGLPLGFEANRGQAPGSEEFLTRGSGYSLSFSRTGMQLSLGLAERSRATAISMKFAGSASDRAPEGGKPLPGVVNYLLGKNPALWERAIPTFEQVKYSAVYPGIDAVFYGNKHELEYDFRVAAKADPGQIRLAFSDSSRLRIERDGSLVLSLQGNELTFRKPVLYQERNGSQVAVDGSFRLLAGNRVGFSVGAYDHSQPLVIDPVLEYATYLGGSVNDRAYAIAVDSEGAAYVAGAACSANFPTTKPALDETDPEAKTTGACAGFVSKLNPAGTALIYSTYLGGSGNNSGASLNYNGNTFFADIIQAIAVDAEGNAYLGGLTYSPNFPVTKGAYQITNEGGENSNGFVAKLNPSGTGLVYSTFLGGSGFTGSFNPLGDQVNGIAVDADGNAYVTGSTYSKNFPVTTGAFQTTYGYTDTFPGAPLSPFGTAFVSKINPSGSGLVYSTFLGGTCDCDGHSLTLGDFGNAIVLDKNGHAFVAGETFANNFPVTHGAYQTANSGGFDAFVTEVNLSGSGLVFSTYLGGSGSDEATSLARDAAGNLYVGGGTYSTDFPVTTGTWSKTGSGFVSKLNSSESALLASTQIENVPVNAIAVAGDGAIYVAGANQADVNGCGASTNALTTNTSGPVVAKLNAGLTAPTYATVLESPAYLSYGVVQALALDSAGNVHVAGSTTSHNLLVTTGAIQSTNHAPSSEQFDANAFVAQLDLTGEVGSFPTATTTSSPSPTIIYGNPLVVNAQVGNVCGTRPVNGNLTFQVDGIAAATVALNTSGEASYSIPANSLSPGTHGITAQYTGNSTFSPSATASETIEGILMPATITLASNANPQLLGQPVTWTATVTGTGTASSIVPTGTVDLQVYESTGGGNYSMLYDFVLPLVNGQVSKTFTNLPVNSYLVGARYVYNTNDTLARLTQLVETQTAAPKISPVSGTYASEVMVTLTPPAAGAKIYYTTDGSIPTTSSTLYSAPFAVTSTEKIRASAMLTGEMLSKYVTAVYTIK